MFFVQINHTGKGFLFLIFREIKLRKYSSLHKLFYGLVELANKLKIDANSLKDTFVKYQNATETGKDEFGKDKTHLEKFTGNDFYGVYAMLGSWETINMKTKSGATKRAIKLHQFGRISNRR